MFLDYVRTMCMHLYRVLSGWMGGCGEREPTAIWVYIHDGLQV